MVNKEHEQNKGIQPVSDISYTRYHW